MTVYENTEQLLKKLVTAQNIIGRFYASNSK